MNRVTFRPVVLLELAGVAQRFGGLQALAGVSLSVSAGERVGLIGANGSGKTTLLNVITGVYRPTAGRISFAGRDLSGRAGHEIARAGIARTFQAPRLFPSLDLEQHAVVALRGEASATSPWRLLVGAPAWRPCARAAREVLSRVGLAALAASSATALPYGRQRLLEIARCLAGEPRLLLLDEPTAGLDTAEAAEVAELLLRENREREVALLAIDHDLPFVRSLCSRIVVLDRGAVIADGPAEDVLRDPRTVAAYTGAEA